MRKSRVILTDKQIVELVDLYNSGVSQVDCAQHFGCSQSHIAICLAKCDGIDPRHSEWKQPRINKLVALYATGKSVSECARIEKTANKTVRKYLRKMKVKIRSQIEATKSGEENGNWKGGRSVTKNGYIYVLCPKGHPRLKVSRYVLEHRLVMEQYIERYLLPKEVVHHKSGVSKQDNCIENLVLFSENSEHLRHELTGKCPQWTEDGIRRIRAADWKRGRTKEQRKARLDALQKQ